MSEGYLSKRKKLHKSHHDKRFVIMQNSPNGPVFLKWSEIEDYLTPEAYAGYDLWYNYYMGFGLPGNKAWDYQNLHVMEIIKTCEQEYRHTRGTQSP